MDKIKNIIKLNYLKDLLANLDKTDLKIMKYGLKICFGILLFSVMLLSFYLTATHNVFLYELGITIFRVSTYIAVEFVVCGNCGRYDKEGDNIIPQISINSIDKWLNSSIIPKEIKEKK